MTRPLTRSDIPNASRIVVKVGSSSISGANADQIAPLVDALATAHARGTEVVLVSSGAIATGMPFLKLDARPTDLATQQAAAAVGQNLLIYRYQESLRRFEIVAGQVLLTAGDLENPAHRSNAERAMERLLGLRILPIVNENDTVATQEIRFGETYINRENFEAMQGFHAGWRKSGIGGADGKHGLYEFLQTHVVYMQRS